MQVLDFLFLLLETRNKRKKNADVLGTLKIWIRPVWWRLPSGVANNNSLTVKKQFFIWFTFLPPTNEVCKGYVFTPVCHSVHWGEGCLPQCMLGYTSPWADTPSAADIPTVADTPCSRHPPPQQQTPHPPSSRHPPALCMLGDTGNKRAVRILLECILVSSSFFLCWSWLMKYLTWTWQVFTMTKSQSLSLNVEWPLEQPYQFCAISVACRSKHSSFSFLTTTSTSFDGRWKGLLAFEILYKFES